jgi:hypothetical protein
MSEHQTSKFSDDEILSYMREFLRDNDQMPPYQTMAIRFGVCPNAIQIRMLKFERKGLLVRNEVHKLMFARPITETPDFLK